MQWVTDVLDRVVIWLETAGEASEPALIILANIAVAVFAALLIFWRVRAEWRSKQWMELGPDERRARVLRILQEAWELAEWLHSHIDVASATQKREIAAQKKDAALAYARKQVVAAGGDGTDLAALPTQMEYVCFLNKPNRERYGMRPWETPKPS